MARARRKPVLSVDERIAAKKEQIAKTESDLKVLKDELKELEAENEAEDQKKLLAAVAASGMTMDEVIALISPAPAEKTQSETAEGEAQE